MTFYFDGAGVKSPEMLTLLVNIDSVAEFGTSILIGQQSYLYFDTLEG